MILSFISLHIYLSLYLTIYISLYLTIYLSRKQKLDESERTGQMLLSDSSEHETNYRPMQFENSLGKLQVSG